jgi:hypothetical protein
MKVIWFSQKNKKILFFFFLAEKLGFLANIILLFLRFPKFLSIFLGIEMNWGFFFLTDFFLF